MDVRNLLGSGLAGKAADDTHLSQIYQRERIRSQTDEGTDLPPLDEWKQKYLQDQAQVHAQAEDDLKQGFDAARGK